MVQMSFCLNDLPDIPGFRRLTKALALLDAILSPEWEYRYYSFDSRWSEGESMASMRNGCGDLWFALFCPAGVALHGLAHEAPYFKPGSLWPGLFEELPSEFHSNFLNEPAFQTEFSTFCIWRLTRDKSWHQGPVKLPAGEDPDGSVSLLSILQGRPEQYKEFASEYYELERDLDVADIAAIYRHAPLTEDLVRRINPGLELEAVRDDIAQIGYPDQATD